MSCSLLPETHEIREAFVGQILEQGGRLADAYEDGTRLFLRSLLAPSEEVRPGDQVQGGVALRTRGEDILVQPYVFRQVCRNGAIMAQSIDSVQIRRLDLAASTDQIEEKLGELREAVRCCSAVEVFRSSVDSMRRATMSETDVVLQMISLLSPLQGRNREWYQWILDRFLGDGDRSQYGLMNAVTAVARDQADPEVRWRLEELGGSVPALVPPTPRPGGTWAEVQRV